jgi:hypothetical protein
MRKAGLKAMKRILLLAATIAAACAFGLLLQSRGSTTTTSAASLNGTCGAQSGQVVSCMFTTSTAIAPGGVLVIQPLAPAGGSGGIPSILSATSFPGCPFDSAHASPTPSSGATAGVVYDCSGSSAGIGPGSTITLQFSLPAGTAPPLSANVFYNDDGPQNQQRALPGTCGSSALPLAGQPGSCSGSAATDTALDFQNPSGFAYTVPAGAENNNLVGGFLVFAFGCPANQPAGTSPMPGGSGCGSSLSVSGPGGTSIPATLGTCSFDSSDSVPTSASPIVVYKCSGTNSIPSGTSESFTVTPATNCAFSCNLSEQTVSAYGSDASVTVPAPSMDRVTFAAAAATATPTPSPAVTPTASPTPTPTLSCGTASEQPGWNLTGGPTGTVLTGAAALYSLPAGASGYQQITPPTTPLTALDGAWAFYFTPTVVTLPCVFGGSMSVTLPPGQVELLSNPFGAAATVSGTGAPTYAITFDAATNSWSGWTGIDGGIALSLPAGGAAFVVTTASGGSTVTIAAP